MDNSSAISTMDTTTVAIATDCDTTGTTATDPGCIVATAPTMAHVTPDTTTAIAITTVSVAIGITTDMVMHVATTMATNWWAHWSAAR